MRVTLDSNILVYALDAGAGEKQQIAQDLVHKAAAADAVLTAQALAELLNVVRRKSPQHFDAVRQQAERWAMLFPVAPTTWDSVSKGAEFAARHRLQLWDCVIWQTARSAGASIFLSEDLRDGFSSEGMTAINPFKMSNRSRVEEVLTPLGDDPS